MKPYIYKIKPELKSVQDLINFVSAIPPGRWISNALEKNGRLCVIGHIQKAYNYYNAYAHIIEPFALMRANNGADPIGTNTSGAKVKTRVLKFLRSQQHDKIPS